MIWILGRDEDQQRLGYFWRFDLKLDYCSDLEHRIN
jgi:hypothetical protein